MFGLSNDTWGLIIFTSIGAVFAFFAVRLVNQLDKLSSNVVALNLTIKKIELDIATFMTDGKTTEAKVNWAINRLIEIKVTAENAGGWKFNSESWRQPSTE